MQPEVSVCVVTYNHANYVKKALDTIFAQRTSFSFEVLVFDDASTDDTCKIIETYYGDKVTLYQHKENEGLTKNLYDALTTANGKYIAMAAGDDWWLSTEYLQVLYEFLEEHDECVSVSPCTIVFDKDEQEVCRLPIYVKEYTLTDFLWSKDNVAATYSGLLRNVFKENNLEWLYLSSRNNDEFQYIFYVLTKGSIGIVNRYFRAYRLVSSGGDNYNSRMDYVDTYLEFKCAKDYVQKHVTNRYKFKYYQNKKGAVALRACLADLIKRKKCSPLKKMLSNTNIIVLLSYCCTLLLLELSNGEYPEWFCKRIRLYK